MSLCVGCTLPFHFLRGRIIWNRLTFTSETYWLAKVGGVVLLALSVVAQTVVPNELVEKVDALTGKQTGGKRAAKNVVNRLMSWGFVLGVSLGSLQLLMLPLLQKSSPLEEVRKAAVIPSILASVYQIMNGLVFIGEYLILLLFKRKFHFVTVL